ncbi:MAG TPA: aldo/keto reductase [Segetibacter sp.]|jgi:aryl-alcohol dehydrogenase-like predicted oxidoreductase
MNYRKFGNTDLQVSEVGFGAWAIGGNAMVGNVAIGWGKADDSTSIEAINKSLEQGITFFDTADIYGLGHSEKLLGDALKGKQDIVIATKVGNVSRNEQFTVDYSKEHILSACEASLKRLRRDVIDYYQLHSARVAHLQSGECIEAMELLKHEGKIRHWGLSLNTFNPEPEAEFLMDANKGKGFQLVFNVINQRGLSLMEKAAQNDYGVIARMPLQFGLLTGKFSSESSFPKDDHRHARLTKEIITSANEILKKKVWTLCDKYQVNKTSLALSFILSFNSVSTVIPGIRTAQHAIDNTSDIVQLEEDDITYLKNLFNSDLKELLALVEKQG